MIKIGEIRGIEVFSKEDINFISVSKNKIFLGVFFNSLSKVTQNTLLNRALIGVEYVNIHNLKSSKDVESKIDLFMNNKAYSLSVISSALKEMYKFLQKSERNDQTSQEMKNLSERFIALQKYANETSREIIA